MYLNLRIQKPLEFILYYYLVCNTLTRIVYRFIKLGPLSVASGREEPAPHYRKSTETLFLKVFYTSCSFKGCPSLNNQNIAGIT